MAQENKTNLKLDGNTQSSQTLKFHKQEEFTELTLEQLFSEPVSLRFIQREDDVLSDDPDDQEEPTQYNFLDLDFETLFSIPVSMNTRERQQEDNVNSKKNLSEGSNYLFDPKEITQINLDSEATVFVKSTEKVKINTPTVIVEPTTPELPPPSPPPVVEAPTINDIGNINETELFLSEAVSITGNLLANDNISPGSGQIISVNGIVNDGMDDLDSGDPETLEFLTDFGRFEVDVFTGDYVYDLLDVSSEDDAQNTISETFTYVYEFDSGGTYSAVLTVYIDLNQAPIGVDDAYDINQDIDLVIATAAAGVLGNDLDPDNSSTITDLKFVSEVDGVGASVGSPVALADGGLLTLNLDGTFTFSPNSDFDYLMEGESATVTFNYTISDSEELTDTATVTITVHGVAPPGITTDEPIDICEVLDPQTESVYWVPCEDVEYYTGELGYDLMQPLRMADVFTTSIHQLQPKLSSAPVLDDFSSQAHSVEDRSISVSNPPELALEPEWISDF